MKWSVESNIKNMIFSVYLKTINKRRYWHVLLIHLFKEIHLILWHIALLTSGVLEKLIVCFTRCTLFFQYVCFLLPICLPCVGSGTYCNEDECRVVTHRVADIRVAWLVDVRPHSNFESKQAIYLGDAQIIRRATSAWRPGVGFEVRTLCIHTTKFYALEVGKLPYRFMIMLCILSFYYYMFFFLFSSMIWIFYVDYMGIKFRENVYLRNL